MPLPYIIHTIVAMVIASPNVGVFVSAGRDFWYFYGLGETPWELVSLSVPLSLQTSYKQKESKLYYKPRVLEHKEGPPKTKVHSRPEKNMWLKEKAYGALIKYWVSGYCPLLF